MTAKPWGECPDCGGTGMRIRDVAVDLVDENGFESVGYNETEEVCPCAKIRSAAFEEVLAVVGKMRDLAATDRAMSKALHAREIYAAIRAKMEGETDGK